MAMRDIIKIDREKCIGCGKCVNACVEGALQMIDGKAQLVKDDYCDGLGACIGDCPVDALTIEKRDASEFDAQAAVSHAQEKKAPPAPKPHGCPGKMARDFAAKESKGEAKDLPSALTHWPIQLKLINPHAPTFDDVDLLVTADCTAAASGAFHRTLLKDRKMVMACPKLDDHEGYVEKLSLLFAEGKARSVTVARMEVPCCAGLLRMVLQAREVAGSQVPVREVIIGVQGDIKEENVK